MEYNIVPEESDTEGTETEDEFSDNVDYLEAIETATTAAYEEGFEIEGAEVVEGSFTTATEAVIDDGSTDIFAEEEDDDGGDDDDDDDGTLAISKSFSFYLITLLCSAAALFGQ